VDADLEDDLRATTESIAADAERLAEIERQKGQLPVEDDRVMDLAKEAESIARKLVHKTVAEVELVEEAQAPG
jgi:hypothetical protein